ncbi:DUF1624 domain-containing protein [Flammeovirga yaeyamensis]|uniref:DUF1624 domain-containing protein n=1 Tax=Flammeovirga yaeyamensis TaxID=367791 RepID=A0AAX1NET7_9BACT|nr:heparan-alpha-glucosaminide N-acetyltransferase domain-containing protein [Flammeovirga yaeyamensis]MBB3699161.1 putative membrane protein [Flammeovirga yaeyamensis]NMF35575.1 DUF1624 domain-containing protein [Flammeovirga yaeyamensis]QWG04433.1 DUF1624 domain-containing protein [Flammeovirga yaeyamensis]
MKELKTTKNKGRITSIDVLRGLVIVIMLLDHVRERFFYYYPVSDPIDINETSPGLFFSRILTHLAAPIFVFLTGLSAWLYANPRGKDPRSASSFLFKRGLFLIFIEIAFINFSWFGEYHTLYLQVIWAIGVSMITLAALSHLPYKVIGILGFLIVFGHNALTPIHFSPDEFGYTLWAILHDRGFIFPNELLKIKASYPVLPWIGVILLGYFAGPIFGEKYSPKDRIKTLQFIGVGSLGLLLILRGFNLYGETLHWETQDTILKTVMDFVNFTKYPPSLDFLLWGIGFGLLILSFLENKQNKITDALKTFGSAPMFFYILHLYVLLILYKIAVAIFGIPEGKYLSFNHLGYVWVSTVVLATILYFPTKKFGDYKRKSNSKWLKYF